MIRRRIFCGCRRASPSFTAAQNAHRLAALQKHFLARLKVVKVQTDCGTATLKSGTVSASEVRCVHLRLRNTSLRRTTDSGFKTAESPALRGFVGERWPKAAISLYLVQLSNGQAAPEIGPKSYENRSVEWSSSGRFKLAHLCAERAQTASGLARDTVPPQRSHTAAHAGKQGVPTMRVVLVPTAYAAC